MVLIAHAEERNERRPMVVLDKVRRENLPSIGDRSGTRKPIGLASGEGLLEPTYCMFGENNVAAMLTSGDGPRAKRLCDYLSAKLSIEVGVDPVLTHDLDQVLDAMRFSSLEVAIPPSGSIVTWSAAIGSRLSLRVARLRRMGVWSTSVWPSVAEGVDRSKRRSVNASGNSRASSADHLGCLRCNRLA
ncbi:MAG: hypothetical protein CME34_19640 [Gordonia sp.]|nr:hypothetical protein [Gordonia sp. (in: high G+C Gram-positive bacteria)]